jgi:hypothetical protein
LVGIQQTNKQINKFLLYGLQGVEIEGNAVLGSQDGTQESLGGGIAIVERCPSETLCSTAIVTIANSTLTRNTAGAAGGGLHFSGGSLKGGLSVSNSLFTANAVDNASQKYQQEGVGGGMFIGRANFSLTDLAFVNNQAYYGGAVFLSADLSSSGATFTRLNATNNKAVLGSAAYWLRSASPQSPLPPSAFAVTPRQATSVATEVLSAEFATAPPSAVQSGNAAPLFSVALLDFYGNVASAELGVCEVVNSGSPEFGGSANPATGDSSTSFFSSTESAQIRPLGAEVGVAAGSAVFSQLEVTGNIGTKYDLQVLCTPTSLGRSRFLQLTGQPLPPLSLEVDIAPCSPGSSPETTSTGQICVECPFNTFNLDGQACQGCPEGAICPGRDELASKANWWRSGQNATEFYACRSVDTCQEGPAAGNDACAKGHEGPLCAVCEEDWYSFGGRCQSCDKSGQAKIMLSLAVILGAVVIVLLFARSWEFGAPGTPGAMTKIKIVLAHFQILSLMRDYDVLWPDATAQGFSWFEMSNFGLGMLAPSCFLGSSYSFWTRWIFQMTLPVLAVGGCVALYYFADWLIQRRGGEPVATEELRTSAADLAEESGEAARRMENQSTPKQSACNSTTPEPGARLTRWLIGLKTRCWKNAFWFLTLLYPGASLTALQMFGTTKLDIGTFLTADFSIMVRPPGGSLSGVYKSYLVPGAIFLTILAIGVPLVWFLAVWRNRQRLDELKTVKKYGFLYASYDRRFFWWETAEALRKFGYAFIPVFIPTNSAGSIQGTVGLIWTLAFIVVIIWLHPFAASADNNIMISSLIGKFHSP